MLKLRVLFFAPLFIGTTVVLAIPELEAKISNKDNQYRYYFYAYIIIGVIANYYVTQYSPYDKYITIKKLQWDLFDALTQTVTSKLYHTYKLKFNIMVPQKKLWTDLEPKSANEKETKRTYRTAIFKPIWQSKESIMHKELQFTINQGLCGLTFKASKAEVAVYSPYIPEHEEYQKEFNFSEKQNLLIGDLKFIASCAIRKKTDSERHRDYIPIAVLNVESYSHKVRELVNDNDMLDELKIQILVLSEIISEHIDI